MTIHRAHAVLDGTSYSETPEGVSLRGRATAITPTRHGDVVIPRGARFQLPLSFLWQHRHDQPLGEVRAAEVSDTDITVGMFMPRPTESATLIERFAEAAESIKLGLVRGLSIGFTALEDGVDVDRKSWTFTFREWNWHELSLVTVPANEAATLQAIQHYAAAPPARAPVAATVPVLDQLPRLARRVPGVLYR